jgi:hypothetical protein
MKKQQAVFNPPLPADTHGAYIDTTIMHEGELTHVIYFYDCDGKEYCTTRKAEGK